MALIIAGLLAFVGFFTAIVIIVVLFQRTIQRHIYLLHKGQLVQEFQVVDLSKCDEDPEQAVLSEEYSDSEYPPAPPLSPKDTTYLKSMGLLV